MSRSKKDMLYTQSRQKRCLHEVTQQIVHPTTGLAKYLSPQPVTLQQWCNFLYSLCGWVNVGIDDDIAEIMRPFGIGVVVAAVNPDLSIYSNRLAARLICKALQMENKEKEWKLILNYDSFIKLAKQVRSMISCSKIESFDQDMNMWLKTLTDRIFWLNIPIPDKVANHIRQLNIGEIITAGGESSFMDINNIRPPEDNIKWFDEDIPIDESEKKELDLKRESIQKMEVEEEYDDREFYKIKKNSSFRLIMNQQSLWVLITIALQNAGFDTNDSTINVYEALKDDGDNLISSFSRMSI